MSCDEDCYGCSGCWSYTALDWIIAEGGLPSSADYPYTSGTTQVDGQCQAWTPAAFTQVASYEYAVPPCTSGSCLSQDKDASRQLAIQEWPHIAHLAFRRKCDHGRAEAALIALWGWNAFSASGEVA